MKIFKGVMLFRNIFVLLLLAGMCLSLPLRTRQESKQKVYRIGILEGVKFFADTDI